MSTERASLELTVTGNMFAQLEKVEQASMRTRAALLKLERTQQKYRATSTATTGAVRKNSTATRMNTSRLNDNRKAQVALERQTKSTRMALARMVGPLAIIGVGKLTENYRRSMGEIASLTDMTTQEVIDKWGAPLKRLAIQNGQNIADLQTAAYQAKSGGVRDSNLIPFLKVSGDLALAAKSTTTEAVETIGRLQDAWGGTAKENAKAAFATVRFGKTTNAEISSSIGRIASLSASLKLSRTEVMSTLAGMTTALPTRQSITALTSLFSGLTKQTDMQKKAQERLGIEFNTNTLRQMGPMGAMLYLKEQLSSRTKDQAKQEQLLGQILGGNVRALIGFMALAESDKAQRQTAAAAQAMNSQMDILDQNAQKVRSTLTFSRAIAQLRVLAITIGEALLPVFMQVLSVVGWFAKTFGGWIKQNATLVKWMVKLAMVMFVVSKVTKIAALTKIFFSKALLAVTTSSKSAMVAIGMVGGAIKSLLLSSGILILLPLLGKLFDIGSSLLGGGSTSKTSMGESISKDLEKMGLAVDGTMGKMKKQWGEGFGKFGGAKGSLKFPGQKKEKKQVGEVERERIAWAQRFMKSLGFDRIESVADVKRRLGPTQMRGAAAQVKNFGFTRTVGQGRAFDLMKQFGMEEFQSSVAAIRNAMRSGDVANFEKWTKHLGLSDEEVIKLGGTWAMTMKEINKARTAQEMYSRALEEARFHVFRNANGRGGTGQQAGPQGPFVPFTPGAGRAGPQVAPAAAPGQMQRYGIRETITARDVAKTTNIKNTTTNTVTVPITITVGGGGTGGAIDTRSIRGAVESGVSDGIKQANQNEKRKAGR